MNHIKIYEKYDTNIDFILDKINKSGKSSLSNLELEYLTAYSISDYTKMNSIEIIEGQKIFDSIDGYFSFKYEYMEQYGYEKYYYGTILVPNIKMDDGTEVGGEMDGYIVVYNDCQISPLFEKDGYGIFEFCNGIEYELDLFLDYVILTIEDEKTVD